jgi:hypothetical protein
MTPQKANKGSHGEWREWYLNFWAQKNCKRVIKEVKEDMQKQVNENLRENG